MDANEYAVLNRIAVALENVSQRLLTLEKIEARLDTIGRRLSDIHSVLRKES